MQPDKMTNRLFLIPLLSIFLSVVSPLQASARFASIEDAPATVTRHSVTIDVDRDGRFVEEEEKEIRIRNEAGREDIGTWNFVYNARVFKVEVLSAEAVTGGKTITVPREAIEDKPVATNMPGFDEYSKITVPFSGVQVDSIVRLRTRRTQKEVSFPGHYSRAFFPGTRAACNGFDLTIRSKTPLLAAVNDPDNLLEISRDSGEQIETHRVRLRKAFFRRLVEEQKSSFLPEDRLPYVQFSTDRTLDVPAASVLDVYEKTIAEPLPAMFDALLKEFANGTGAFVDRLNALTSSFSGGIRYFGDWRPNKNGYVPRHLAQIASSQYGDCKDMATAVAAILRNAGVGADIAWIHRGAIPPVPLPLATPDAYNHAVVRVAHEGTTYWIDPTNQVSFAQGIPADLMGRDALVLENGKLRKTHVPFLPPSAGTIRGIETYNFTPGGNAKIKGRMELLGRQAELLTGLGRFSPPDTIKFGLLRFFSGGRRVVTGTVGEFDMLSPIVKDMTIDFTAEVEGVAIRTTAGLAYGLSHKIMRMFSLVDPAKDQGDLFLGPPGVSESIERIAGSSLVGKNPGVCAVESPWVDASWEAGEESDDLLVTSKVTLKKPVLTHAEIASQSFADLQAGIRRCFGDYALVFEAKTGLAGEGLSRNTTGDK
ncbi:MAG: DUF3857 domain-containing protein [Deltaproteobacteria bacterium]|nr:DUF3857 domain-containing protein [Deltaproteobacteria bacterium]